MYTISLFTIVKEKKGKNKVFSYIINKECDYIISYVVNHNIPLKPFS